MLSLSIVLVFNFVAFWQINNIAKRNLSQDSDICRGRVENIQKIHDQFLETYDFIHDRFPSVELTPLYDSLNSRVDPSNVVC